MSRIDKGAKETRDKRIFDMWLACYSYKEIAKIVNSYPTEAKRVVSSETADLPNRTKPASEHLTNFEPPLYIWKHRLYVAKKLGLKQVVGKKVDYRQQHLFKIYY